MDEFKAGDVVVLKSGGPSMTVRSVFMHATDRVPIAECTWFLDGKPTSASFPVAMLEADTRNG